MCPPCGGDRGPPGGVGTALAHAFHEAAKIILGPGGRRRAFRSKGGFNRHGTSSAQALEPAG